MAGQRYGSVGVSVWCLLLERQRWQAIGMVAHLRLEVFVQRVRGEASAPRYCACFHHFKQHSKYFPVLHGRGAHEEKLPHKNGSIGSKVGILWDKKIASKEERNTRGMRKGGVRDVVTDKGVKRLGHGFHDTRCDPAGVECERQKVHTHARTHIIHQ